MASPYGSTDVCFSNQKTYGNIAHISSVLVSARRAVARSQVKSSVEESSRRVNLLDGWKHRLCALCVSDSFQRSNFAFHVEDSTRLTCWRKASHDSRDTYRNNNRSSEETFLTSSQSPIDISLELSKETINYKCQVLCCSRRSHAHRFDPSSIQRLSAKVRWKLIVILDWSETDEKTRVQSPDLFSSIKP